MVITEWNKYIFNLPVADQDIYFDERYLLINQPDGYKAKAFVHQEGKEIFIFPFYIGQIPNTEYFDVQGPYGYGGPICNSSSAKFHERAWSMLHDELVSMKVVAGFFRFHPMYPYSKEFVPNFIVTVLDRNTVVIPLDLSADQIWNDQIHLKHRNAIRKSEKMGLEVAFLKGEQIDLSIFKVIYEETMSRLDADDFYYFSPEYFSDLKKELGPFLVQGNVIFNGKVICSALFLKYGQNVHYHLSGTLTSALDTGANGFLIFKAISEFKAEELKYFHLGGGNNSLPDNSLLKFKSRFSKNLLSFEIGKMVLQKQVYEELCRNWKDSNEKQKVSKFEKLHLKYRY